MVELEENFFWMRCHLELESEIRWLLNNWRAMREAGRFPEILDCHSLKNFEHPETCGYTPATYLFCVTTRNKPPAPISKVPLVGQGGQQGRIYVSFLPREFSQQRVYEKGLDLPEWDTCFLWALLLLGKHAAAVLCAVNLISADLPRRTMVSRSSWEWAKLILEVICELSSKAISSPVALISNKADILINGASCYWF